MTDGSAFAYDTVAYPTPILAMQTPDRLRAAGLVHGWSAPEASTASVLEIGCGDGFNLIGIATAAPQSHCVGFDLSGEAIARGVELATATGLSNIDLHKGDILDYPHDGKKFDYVVCHGVYSWIPQMVRQPLLELIGARLAPGGMAYLSFDTLPASGPKAAINRFLLRELAGVTSLEQRVTGAVRLLQMLQRNQRAESRLSVQIDQLLNDLAGFDPAYFFHDWLAEFYAPVDLEQFGTDAAAAGLKRAGDAGMYDLFTGDLDEEARAMVEACGDDITKRCALLHMFRGSHQFRREMLVRIDAPPSAIDWADARQKLWFGYLGNRSVVDDEKGPATKYSDGPDGFVMARDADMITMMDCLLEVSPAELTFDQLRTRTGIGEQQLSDLLRGAVVLTLVDVHSTPQNFSLQPGDRPVASPLVRAMMVDGQQAISLRHSKFVANEEPTRVFLAACDGSRNRAQLADEMAAHYGDEVGPQLITDALADMVRFRLFQA